MTKKIISLILAFVLCMPFTSFAYDENRSHALSPDIEDINSLIYLLCGKAPTLPAEQVTRGDFLTLLVNLITKTTPFGTDSDYSDISKGSELSYCAYYANNLGIISDSESFYPDSYVSVNEALKMIVSALGYNQLAMLGGGYPVGYLKIAANLDLDDGIDLSQNVLNSADFSTLLYNMLCTQMYDISGIYGEDAIYAETEKTLLETVYGISFIEGVVSANRYTSLTSPTGGTGSDSLVIGNYTIKTDNGREYLGKNVRAFVTEKQGLYEAVSFVLSENSIVSFNNDDYPEFKDGSIYIGLEKPKKFKLSKVPVYILNGKNADLGDLNSIFASGEITASLIDNDSDRSYDVVILNTWNYCLVETSNVYGGIIADRFSKLNNIDFSSDDCEYEISGENITDIYDVTEGMLLAFCVSEDEKFIDIKVQNNISKQTIEGKNELSKILNISGADLRYGEYFERNYIKNLTLGESISLIFGINGEIVAIGEAADAIQYGYIIAFDEGTGFSPARLKLINQNSKIQIYEITKKLTADGSKISVDDFITKVNTSEPLIRYRTTADGNLKNVDFVKTETSGLLSGLEDKNNSLTFFKEGTYTYKSDSATLTDKFNLSSTTVFIVPEDGETGIDSNYSAASSSVFKNDQRVTLSVYDVDTKLNSGVVVWKSSSPKSVSSSDRSRVVCSVNPAVAPNGETAYCINVFSNSRYDRLYSNEKSETKIKALRPGDIVRLSVSDDGLYVEDIVHEYSCSEDKLYSSYGSGTTIDYVKGYVYDTSKSHISLVNQGRKSTILPTADNLFTAAYNGDCIFVHVTLGTDGIAEKARVVTYPGQAVQGWISVGDGAAYAVIDRNYYSTRNIFVYIFESR